MSVQMEQALIHVVDDDEAVRSSLTLLGEARGWQMKTYANAQDYLAEPPSPQGQPECLILDLQLPSMNGTQLLEELRKSGREITTIILTAWPDSDLAKRALQVGAKRVLSKPFDPGEWISTVEESLSGPSDRK